MRASLLLLRRQSTTSRRSTRLVGAAGRLCSAQFHRSPLERFPRNIINTRPLSQLIDKSLQWRILQDETDLLLSTPQEAVVSSDNIVDLLARWQSHPNANQAAEASHELLYHWLKSPTKLSTEKPFLLTMQAWSRSGNAYKAADVLQLWVQLLEGDMELAPTREAYHVLLECFGKQGILEDSLSLLQYMERMQSIGNLTLSPPNVETYAHVVTSLTRHSDPSQWDKLQEIMDRLNKVYQDAPQNVYYRLQAYSQAVSFAVSIGKEQEALALLNEGLDRKNFASATAYWEEIRMGASPSHFVGSAYQSVLSMSWQNAPDEMDALHTQLEKFPPESGLPWPQHYAITIEAFSSASVDKDDHTLREVASRCEDLLRRMEVRHLAGNSYDKMSLAAYERVLWMYARGRQPAERLLAHVMSLLEEHADRVVVVDGVLTAAWNHVLRAYHLTRQPEKVMRLWQRMKARNVQSNNVTAEMVLRAISCMKRSDAARQAELFLRSISDHDIEITAAHYEVAVVAWSRSSEKGAAAAAQALLWELERLYDAADQRRDKLRPTVSMYNAVITAWARCRNHAAAKQVLERMMERAKDDKDCPTPDAVSLNAILDGLSRERSRTAARKAEDLLATMESLENAQPDQKSYTSVMSAIVRSGDWEAPERVMRVYKRMQAASKEAKNGDLLRPDVVTYGMLLDMWAKSKRDDAGERAEQLLRDMQNDGLNTNVVNYNNTILAHARSKKPRSFERAEALLREMEMRDAARNQSVRPNTVTFTNVIQALKRSYVQDKAQVAWNLLQEMLRACGDGNTGLCPNIISFNSVITACAFTKGDEKARQRAVKLALAVFTEMEKLKITPNSNSFRMLLETFERQVSDVSERTKMAKIAFQRCHREGLVDSLVVGALQKSVPPLYEQIASSLEVPIHPNQLDQRNNN